MMREPVAQLRRISRIYRKPGTDIEVAALRELDLDLIRGEYTAIMGASGSGKSTLMNLLGCLDRPTTGSYILGDADVSKLDDDALSLIRGKNIGFVFQNFNLIQQLTVLENLEVSMFYSFLPRHERHERAMKLAERVGLSDRIDHRPNQLSGGQQQRVCIARALTNDPLILLNILPSRTYFTRLLENEGITPKISFASPSLELVRGLVGQGLGYSLLITRPHGDATYDGEPLAIRPLVEEVEDGVIAIAALKSLRPTRLISTFEEFCVNFFKTIHPTRT